MTAPQNFGNATGKLILVLVPQFPPCRKWFSQNGRKADNYGYPRIVYSAETLEIARILAAKKYHDAYSARGTFQMGQFFG